MGAADGSDCQPRASRQGQVAGKEMGDLQAMASRAVGETEYECRQSWGR